MLKKKIIPIFLFFLLVFIAGWIRPLDPDFFGHFAMGRVIAQQGIPHHEVMSQAGPTRPYIPTEWLFQIGLYWFLTIFGFSSYHLFNAIFTTIQILFLFILLRKIFRLNLILSLILCLSYSLLNYQFLVQRPQIVTNTFLIIELIIIFKYIFQNKNYLIFLIPIIYFWTNMQASFFIGIIVCLAYCGFCFLGIFSKNRKIWLRRSLILFLITMGMIITSILPPQKLGEYQDLLLMYKNNYIMRVVNVEWAPLFRYFFPTIFYTFIMLISILSFFIVTLYKKMLTKSAWILPLFAFIPTGYLAVRNLYYGYFISILIFGWILSHIKWSKIKLILFITLFSVILVIESWIAIVGFEGSTHEWLEKASDFILKENLKGAMFNQFSYGGYLEYRLYPYQKVFMDGRAEPFFCCEMKDFYTLQVNSSKPVNLYQNIFYTIFDKYRFSYAVLVTKNDPSGIVISNMLSKNQLWLLVYKDDLSEIWVKNDGKNTDLINKLKTNQIQQPSSSDVKIFSDYNMNITFSYPKNLQIYRINPKIVSLASPANKDTNNMLFIYSSIVSKNETSFNIPFTLSGKLKSNVSIPVGDFSASQVIYSDGKNETDLVILRKNQQIVIMRIPQNSKYVDEAINDFIDSIKLLH